MLASWPLYDEANSFPADEAKVERAKDVVRGMRQLRVDMDVPPSKKAAIHIVSDNAEVRDVFAQIESVYKTMAGATEVYVQPDKTGISEDAVSAVIADATLFVPLEDLVDFEKEKERLTREKERLEKELARSKGMLSNEKFMSKSPEANFSEEREKMAKYEQMMAQVVERLNSMK